MGSRKKGGDETAKWQKEFTGWHLHPRPTGASSDHGATGKNSSQGTESKSVLDYLQKGMLLISQTCQSVWIN